MFEKINNNFYCPYDLEFLDKIPVVHHTYGTVSDIPDELVWMTYGNLPTGGEISFSRNTSTFCPEITKYVAAYLQNLFTFSIFPERVHFMRTRGSIPPHRDESNRKSCVNICIKACSSAVTQFCLTDNFEDFTLQHVDFICEDSSAYLLDTARIHAVQGSSKYRLFFTYGFGHTFSQVKSALK